MEHPINEAAVWSRVTAASRSGGGASGGTGPIGGALLAAAGEKQTLYALCRQLGGRLEGENARRIRGIMGREKAQRQTLLALYFFLTGERPAPSPLRSPETFDGAAGALRRLLGEMERFSGEFSALADRSTGQVRQVLLEMAQEEAAQFGEILEMLGRML